MLELPEALTLAAALNKTVRGKTVAFVAPPTKVHKFCFRSATPEEYHETLTGKTVLNAAGFGMFAELAFSDGVFLSVNDGVNVRFISDRTDVPRDYQMQIGFTDGTALVFTVAMYGGMFLHDGGFDNEYYLKSRAACSPFSDAFAAHYKKQFAACQPNASEKAFLATGQHFPGLGNGVLQDILFAAGIHPKRKLQTLTEDDRKRLLDCTVSVLRQMTDAGGRDTEKRLDGTNGGYRTRLSRNTLAFGCPVCGGAITKEAYLGGAVYFCSHCQPLA